jgi:hypothetical protein
MSNQSFCLFSILKALQTFEVSDGNKRKEKVYCFTILTEAINDYNNCSKWSPPSPVQSLALFNKELVCLVSVIFDLCCGPLAMLPFVILFHEQGSTHVPP